MYTVCKSCKKHGLIKNMQKDSNFYFCDETCWFDWMINKLKLNKEEKEELKKYLFKNENKKINKTLSKTNNKKH